MNGVFVVKNSFFRAAFLLKAESKKADVETAREMPKKAQARAAVLTGFMRSQIHATGNTVTAGAWYSGFQDRGTSKMKAHPFWTPAMEEAQRSHEARLRLAMREMAAL